jgi:hypothetical protein
VLQTALHSLYSHYKEEFEDWKRAGIKVPPVFIVVCNNTATSKLVYEWISGWQREVEGENQTIHYGHLKLFSNYDELRNPLARSDEGIARPKPPASLENLPKSPAPPRFDTAKTRSAPHWIAIRSISFPPPGLVEDGEVKTLLGPAILWSTILRASAKASSAAEVASGAVAASLSPSPSRTVTMKPTGRVGRGGKKVGLGPHPRLIDRSDLLVLQGAGPRQVISPPSSLAASATIDFIQNERNKGFSLELLKDSCPLGLCPSAVSGA